MSFLTTRSFRTGMLVGTGIGVAGWIVYSVWKHRKFMAVEQSLVKSYTEPDFREKLKSMLQNHNVHCSDIDYVIAVIDNLIVGGADQLQVIADFDATMTPLKHNGQTVPSSYCVVESSEQMDQGTRDKLLQLKKYYMAIEIDPALTIEEKTPFMIEWAEKTQGITMGASLTKSGIAKAVSDSNLYLRQGYGEIMEQLHRYDIPLLVFSAGIGDVIQNCFTQRYRLYENMHIIANWLDFSHEGLLVGFKGERIHVYNKNTHAIENADYFDNIQHRHNVILLGDSLGDLNIVEGLTNKENLLTIGYLNHHVEASLPEYKRRYDIVLADEDSVELLALLLNSILAENST